MGRLPTRAAQGRAICSPEIPRAVNASSWLSSRPSQEIANRQRRDEFPGRYPVKPDEGENRLGATPVGGSARRARLDKEAPLANVGER